MERLEWNNIFQLIFRSLITKFGFMDKFNDIKTENLYAHLVEGVSPKNIKMKDLELLPFDCDGLTVFRQKPKVVVLPESEEELIFIVKKLSDLSVPLVTRGAGTGLSGGALPHPNGVLVVMTKFNKILSIDEDNQTARVQPGVRNLAISEAVKSFGLFYAPDPSSQIACSIGGNVAENSGGVHCLKYGLTLHNILAVKVLLSNGKTVILGSEAPDTVGYDLLPLFVGSEGLLGIVIEVVVKLRPLPEECRVVMASFDDIEKASNAVATIISSGVIPAGLEMMDQTAIKATESFIGAGYPVDSAAMLLCEVDGSFEETNSQVQNISAILGSTGATEVRLADNDIERELFWKGRKSAFPAVGRISPDYLCMDGTIPRRHLGAVLKRIEQMSQNYQLRVANVFHAGDGNLHPLILFDSQIPGELLSAKKFGKDILELCVSFGGTITGEHGVGVEKIDQMCIQFSKDELIIFEGLKRAFDEAKILNPGKAIPTLNRCAEFGMMHVHDGKLPYSELPRF